MNTMPIAYDEPMLRIVEIRRFASDGSERVNHAWQYVARQPSWIMRAVLIVFLIVLAIPIVLLFLIALAAAALFFLVLIAANAIAGLIRGRLSAGSGRSSNVRVVRRDGGQVQD